MDFSSLRSYSLTSSSFESESSSAALRTQAAVRFEKTIKGRQEWREELRSSPPHL